MKNVFLVLMLIASVTGALAQKSNNVSQYEQTVAIESKKAEAEPNQDSINMPSTGDLFEGMTRKFMFDRIIPPYGLEVSFDKTVHIIFPSGIKYVDLGSSNIIAGKADGVDNVLRVKAATKKFETETNMAVITGDGNYYTFNIKYADEPQKLNLEMKDFMHDGEVVNRPNNSIEIYLNELRNESPKLVQIIMKAVYDDDKQLIKHIGCKKFGIQFLLKGIYTHDGMLYFHTQVKNSSNVGFDVDFIRFKIVDKKLAKRTAIQETVVAPLRAYNNVTCIDGKKTERTVFAMEKITIADDKQLIVEVYEKNGGRNQSFIINNEDLVRAEQINELKIK